MITTTATLRTAEHLRPKSLPEGLVWLWSDVLFPGEATQEGPIRFRAVVLLLLLPAVLLYGSISFHLLEPDEARYAEIPREMLQRGDWVVPHLQGQPYLDKPPLLYWFVMLSYRLFGVDEGAARLIPALALHATILLVYLLGRRHLGERAAFWASVTLTFAPGFISMGRLLILDGLLGLWTTAATLSALEALRSPNRRRLWWCVSWLAAGLGILTKGPVILILVLSPLWMFSRLQNRWQGFTWLEFLQYLLGSAGVSLPWYIAIGLQEPIFLRYFFWEHNLLRFFAPFDHIRPIWFYLPIVLAGMWPGTIFLLGTLASFFRAHAPAHRPPELGFYLLTAGWVVLFFSLSGSKLPTYILPSFPFLALAAGWYVSVSSARYRIWAATLLGIMASVLVWGHYVVLPWYAKLRSPCNEPDKIIPYCADLTQPVICFPRSCDSVAFYLRRDDLRNIRSKNFPELIEQLRQNSRTVLLCTHRHSFESICNALPPDLRITTTVSFRRPTDGFSWFDRLATETPWGLCDLVVIERIP